MPTVERLAIPATTLTSGNQVLYKFKVTADPAGDVALHKIVFGVPATVGMGIFNVTLRNVTDGNKRVSAALPSTSPASTAIIYADTTDYSVPWVTIPAGQSHIFELRADITTDGTADSVSTRLLGDIRDTSKDFNFFTMIPAPHLTGGDYSNFVWSDFSSEAKGNPLSLVEAAWMNGFKIPGLPSTGLESSTLSN